MHRASEKPASRHNRAPHKLYARGRRKKWGQLSLCILAGAVARCQVISHARPAFNRRAPESGKDWWKQQPELRGPLSVVGINRRWLERKEGPFGGESRL